MRFEFRQVFEFVVLTGVTIWYMVKLIFRLPILNPDHCKDSFND